MNFFAFCEANLKRAALFVVAVALCISCTKRPEVASSPPATGTNAKLDIITAATKNTSAGWNYILTQVQDRDRDLLKDSLEGRPDILREIEDQKLLGAPQVTAVNTNAMTPISGEENQALMALLAGVPGMKFGTNKMNAQVEQFPYFKTVKMGATVSNGFAAIYCIKVGPSGTWKIFKQTEIRR